MIVEILMVVSSMILKLDPYTSGAHLSAAPGGVRILGSLMLSGVMFCRLMCPAPGRTSYWLRFCFCHTDQLHQSRFLLAWCWLYPEKGRSSYYMRIAQMFYIFSLRIGCFDHWYWIAVLDHLSWSVTCVIGMCSAGH